MKTDIWSYSKNEGVRRECSPTILPVPISTISAQKVMIESFAYSKSEGTIEPKMIFVISGGERKEKVYLQALLSEGVYKRIQVVFVSKKNGGMTPEQMRKEASDSLQEECFCDINGRVYCIMPGDSIYLVQDVDHFGKELRQMYQEDKEKKYRWIVSNPCFEMWLFYHYQDDIHILDDMVAMCHTKRSSWLKGKLDSLQTNKLWAKVDIAIVNSKRHYCLKDGFPDLFSTDMYIVAEDIKQTMEQEYDLLVSRCQRRAIDSLQSLLAEKK